MTGLVNPCVAKTLLTSYQERRKPWGQSGGFTDMPGAQLQAYQNWRTEWMQLCLSHIPWRDNGYGGLTVELPPR